MNEKKLTPEDVATLKEEIMKEAEMQLGVKAEMTRDEAIDAVINSLEALKSGEEMGGMKGMGEDSEEGLSLKDLNSDSDGE